MKNQLKSNSRIRQESMNVCRTVWSECGSWQCSCSLHFRCPPSALKATFDVGCSCPRQWPLSRLLGSQHLTSFRFSTQELLGSCRSLSDLQTCSLEIQKVTSPRGSHSQPRAPDRSWGKSLATHFLADNSCKLLWRIHSFAHSNGFDSTHLYRLPSFSHLPCLPTFASWDQLPSELPAPKSSFQCLLSGGPKPRNRAFDCSSFRWFHKSEDRTETGWSWLWAWRDFTSFQPAWKLC